MSFRFALPDELRGAVDQAAADWTVNNKVARFWQKDSGLWTRDGEEKWLGWIDIVERQRKDLAALASLGAEVKTSNFQTVLLLGMGGSSLCPEVLSLTFGQQPGFPELRIVDSTDPEQVWTVRNEVNLASTLVVVASKSGSTLEPNILKQFFFNEMREVVGADQAGCHFMAITDPGSKMEQVTKEEGFRNIFYGDPTIGGRFSALSNFGVVVSTLAGLNTEKLLAEAAKATASAKLEPDNNPAVKLGLTLGMAAKTGLDKLTIFTSPEIFDLGAWMEQLIAESTGKQGLGITPVDRETIAAPQFYGKDRIFVYIRYAGTADSSADSSLAAKVAAIEAAGHPVVTIEIADLYEIFGQFFTWEVATAVAGSVMGINPFNQPDVESAKIETRALTAAYEQTGKLPVREPVFVTLADGQEFKLYATEAYAAMLNKAAPAQTLAGYLRAHLNQIQAGDYFAVLAYLPMFPMHEAVIQGLRHKVRDAKRVATCLGFGPRFLHSTGQDYKGGPNTGVFLQITADHAVDVAIPGQKLSFGVVIDAQAAGDMAVLESRGRRALRVHLGSGVATGLKTLAAAIDEALA
ncbi:MAG TPA: bifunctional transaldolase/phosoglucose isomerase [Terracidiphilus sp.]|nr:bifunctional transaldolase/phosoglucose isomerase [Terracidiphilus sp.]